MIRREPDGQYWVLRRGDVDGVFSSVSSTRDYLIDKKKEFPLMIGVYITVFELDKGMIWHGNWEWLDGELQKTDGEYVHKSYDTCGKTRKVVDLDSMIGAMSA